MLYMTFFIFSEKDVIQKKNKIHFLLFRKKRNTSQKYLSLSDTLLILSSSLFKPSQIFLTTQR